MRNKYSYIFLVMLLIVTISSCRDDDGSFENKWFNTTAKVNTTFVKAGMGELEQVIKSSIAQPLPYDVIAKYGVDQSLVSVYNKAYYDNAVILPEGYYSIPVTSDTVTAGSVNSKGITVKFMELGKLEKEQTYVLPVTVASANLSVLNSAKTSYYVFKGASLINVVADVEKNYLFTSQWKDAGVLNNLGQLTMEALIRARDYDRLISTVMGIEGYFLIRIGDAGFPSNQIQIATRSGNFPDADSSKGLPTNKWVHIALTYDSSTGALILYVDGKMQASAVKSLGSINLGQAGKNGFCIGYSYNEERFIAGEISECRIWNVVRTQEEIAANPYYVASDSPGLVAYWKFDEGEGTVIHDRTANGNDMTASEPLKWTQVNLPE